MTRNYATKKEVRHYDAVVKKIKQIDTDAGPDAGPEYNRALSTACAGMCEQDAIDALMDGLGVDIETAAGYHNSFTYY